MSDPKPERRVVNSEAGREKVRSEGRCRITGQTYALTRFHLVGRDLGGDDVDDNLVPVAFWVHDAWEHSPDGKTVWGPHLWRHLSEPERAYVLGKKGPDYVRSYFGVDL